MEVVTGVMSPLLCKLGDLLTDEFKLKERVKKGIRSLRKELELMRATLIEVGKVPPDELHMEVRIWVGKVRELSYDMEDAVDGFMVRLEEGHDGEPNNVKKRVKKFLKKTTGLFTKRKALHGISDAIQEAQDEAKELAERRDRYKLDMNGTSARATIDPRQILMCKDVTELVGIEDARDELIQMLIDGEAESKQQPKTISIVGVGGLGKTTLAEAVYDEMKVQFDCGAFVSVSRTPDKNEIFKNIMYKLDKEKFKHIHSTTRSEDLLIDDLREYLEDKRYLIIIDDIWDEITWGTIQRALPRNNFGNRIITTTRNLEISEACCSSSKDIIYRMKYLSPEDSQRLFYRRIFSSEKACPDELQEISKDILKKCGGIPLAIIAIASLLASKQEIWEKEQWCRVLRSIGRGHAEGNTMQYMQRILSLSYYDLPSHLKACLLYLSIFPEDYEIERERLIWRWIGEGFIHPGKQESSLFKLGESYFNELINRSLIVPIDIDCEDKARACRVHDMVLDLIRSLSSEENFLTLIVGNEQSIHDSENKVRRLSLQHFSMAEFGTSWLDDKISMSQVRSVSLFVSSIYLMPFLSRFEILRVLDLEGCNLLEEKDKINLRHLGNLLHLRYLRLRYTSIDYLPSKIGKLQSLQTLDIRGAPIKELPSSVVELRQMMCLWVNRNTMVPPSVLGKLISLEELHVLDVDHFSQDDFEELSHLTKLRVLEISFCSARQLNESRGEALAESIDNMHRLESLEFGGDVGCMNFMPEDWVPPRRLRRFSTGFKWFPMLPKWINPSLLPSLLRLWIFVHKVRWEDIQIIGMLPALRYLNLWAFGSMEERAVDQGFVVTVDVFPYLRECRFTGLMRILPSMFPPKAMPMLRYLSCGLAPRDMAIGGLDLSMDHLPSLERVEVDLWCHGASDEEVNAAEAALRHAAGTHPNHLTLQIRRR